MDKYVGTLFRAQGELRRPHSFLVFVQSFPFQRFTGYHFIQHPWQSFNKIIYLVSFLLRYAGYYISGRSWMQLLADCHQMTCRPLKNCELIHPFMEKIGSGVLLINIGRTMKFADWFFVFMLFVFAVLLILTGVLSFLLGSPSFFAAFGIFAGFGLFKVSLLAVACQEE